MRLHIDLPALRSATVRVVDGERLVAAFEMPTVREEVTFEVDAVPYRARRAASDAAIVLTNLATGLPEAQSVRSGWSGIDRTFEAVLPDGTFTRVHLHRAGSAEPRIDVHEGDGRRGPVVGQIRRTARGERRVALDLPDAWPAPLCVFVGWHAARQFVSDDVPVI